jgi:hypothetical protein
MYDSVSETAFGSLFRDYGNHETPTRFDAEEVAEMFLKWYAKHGPERDPRVDSKIADSQHKFVSEVLPTITDIDSVEDYKP